jgi:hypothetical protein
VSRHESAAQKLKRWALDPVAFVKEELHAEPDDWQADALSHFPTVKRLALKAAKGCGKTTLLAWCILNFLCTRPESQIAAISISGDNLRDGLWKELALWMGKSPLLSAAFDWHKERITNKLHPGTWWVSARQWSKSADAQQQSDALAGLHSPYMLFVMDESGSIPQAIAVTAEAVLASGVETKVLQAGNPTQLEGPLYTACTTQRDLWYVVDVTGDPDDPKRASRIDLGWAQQQVLTYGRDNPWVMVNVLGQFPSASLNALLGVEEVNQAMRRHLREDQYEWSQRRLGVDVARYGDDRTVIFPRWGLAAFRPMVLRHDRGTSVSVDIANRVMAAKAKWGSEVEFFDATGGWAAGAVDVMRAAGQSPIDVQFAAPAVDPRYANRRAEIWFAMAEWVKRGGALPPIPEMVPELTSPTYAFHRGKFLLEDKDQVKKRLGRSPDLADALALTFGLVDMPATATGPGAALTARARQQQATEFDPYRQTEAIYADH